MTPNEYIEAACQKLGGVSEYELARRLQLKHQQISAFKLRKANLPAAAAFRLAITLEADPAAVFADLESQWEKDEKKRDFWTGFLSRARVPLLLACILASSFTATLDNARATLGGNTASGLAALAAACAAATRYLRRWQVRIICIL